MIKTLTSWLLGILLGPLSMISCGQELATNNVSATPPNTSPSQKNAEGWNRYYLDGPNGDIIGVYLPKQPDRFPGVKLRGGNNVVSADRYLVAENEETYVVAFVYGLSVNAEQMLDDQKAEIFFASWRGTVEQVRQVLEEKLGRPIEIRQSEQAKLNVSGREGRVQEFTVGPYLGQARMLFVERRGYMLIGVWPQDKAKQRSASFFDSFEMRIKH